MTVFPEEPTTYTLTASGTFADTAYATVNILPSGVILTFTADPEWVVEGESSTLSWTTTIGSAVTLDGVPVAEDGSISVTPAATTTYTLNASGEANEEAELTVVVLDPSGVNRALDKPVYVSSIETCCGNEDPNFAVDGDPYTRWSSLWTEPEWIYVDLLEMVSIERVVLNWEVAYGRVYDIQISDDSQDWTTIFSETNSDGNVDDISGLSGTGRFVRMYGIERATEWGFSLWEFEVYGLFSAANMFPTVTILEPEDGDHFDLGEAISITVDAVDDHEVLYVDFFVGDLLLGSDPEEPYQWIWTDAPEGIHWLTAAATDDSSGTMISAPNQIVVGEPFAEFRYEAEDAFLLGGVTIQNDPLASESQFVRMSDSGSMQWTFPDIPMSMNYTITIGYRLIDGSKNQNILVNGIDLGEVSFNGPIGIWIERNISVGLHTGENTVAVAAGWGWMDVDYIDLWMPVPGCTDPNAGNYNPDATFDDGSCVYDLLAGDLDLNDELNVSDVVILVGVIIGSYDPTAQQLLAADVNEDGNIDVLDIVLLVEIILS